MNWIGLLVLLAIVVGMTLLRRARQISKEKTRELLRKGAIIVDVRTASEFANGRLTRAINIPLDQIESALPQRFPDRDKAILLYCQSGMRSGVAQKRLRALGYLNAFNMGGYGRAAQMVGRRD